MFYFVVGMRKVLVSVEKIPRPAGRDAGREEHLENCDEGRGGAGG